MNRCRSCRALVRTGAALCPGCGAPQVTKPRLSAPVRSVLFAILLGAGAIVTAIVVLYAARPFLARMTPDPVRSAIVHLPSVLTLTAYSDSGDAFVQGSGFLVEGPGLAITNYHVLAGAHRVEVTCGDGRSFDVTGIESWDPVRDVCVFRVGRVWENMPVNPPLDLEPLALRLDAPARVGERIVALGSPKGFANSLSDGLVSALRTEDGKDYVQFTAPISHGSSGGPLFDDRGQVVGMAVGTGDGAQNLNFAIPARSLKPYLAERHGWTLEQVREQARDTVKIEVEAADRLLADRRFREALSLYSRANDFDPRSAEAALGLALCYRLLESPEEFEHWSQYYAHLEPDERVRRRDTRALLARIPGSHGGDH